MSNTNRYEPSKERLLAIFHIFQYYFDKIFPNKHCYLCHQTSDTLVCKYCLTDTYLHLLPAPGHNLLENQSIVENIVPPLYSGLYALSEYKGIVRALVNQLKFSGKTLAANVLAEFFEYYLGGKLNINQAIPEAIIPIPLSNQRHISRQYNQSRILSLELAKHFSINSDDLLLRTVNTKQQSSLDKNERMLNIRGAFKVAKPIEYSSIALVDDVVTTGATINEACKTILEHNPDIDISVWCMAITLK